MTTTSLPGQISTLRRTLAEATKECPIPEPFPHPKGCPGECGGVVVARFPGFRQECRGRLCFDFECGDTTYVHSNDIGTHDDTCCWGIGWQVRAGGLEDALAGLTYEQYNRMALRFDAWLAKGDIWWGIRTYPMPSAPEILLKGLEVVCEMAELEVPDGGH